MGRICPFTGENIWLNWQAVGVTQLGIQPVKEPAGFNKKVISHRLPLEELQRGIERIERGNEPVYKVMILPNG